MNLEQVLMPGRIVSRHVGGNTTYALNIAEGLRSRGVAVGEIPYGSNPISTLLHENFRALRKSASGTLLHYVADTGPLVPTRTPSVATVHGISSRWTKVARSEFKDRVWRSRVGRAIKSTSALITVSKSSANDISDVFGVDIDDIHVIHHGIDYAKFSEPTELSQEVETHLPSDFALYLGNIEPRKNLDNLIQAFQSKNISESGLQLVIAGRPAWDYEKTLELIARYPNVHHLGFVSDSDRIALMQRCKFFVFPSHYEGFGFPVLEAMAAGAPVVASSAGSLAEVGGPARRIEDLSADGIAVALEAELHADDTSRVVELGREWAASFSWDRSVDKHIQVYKEALCR